MEQASELVVDVRMMLMKGTTVTVQYKPPTSQEQTMKDFKEKDEETMALEKDLAQFLRNFVNDMTPEIAYQILQNYGRFKEFLELAELNHDYGALILDHINKQEYEEALSKIEHIREEAKRNELMIRYAGIFLRNIPERALGRLRERKFQKIEVAKLVPALMSVEPKHRAVLIEYLHYCLQKLKVREKTVTNLLVLKLAEGDNKKDIWEFLRKEEMKFKSGQAIYFDIEHALNVCRQYELIRPQVLLYSMLSQFERAVVLALQNYKEDERLFDLAQTYADGPSDDRQSKKLWLKIAQYLLKPGESNIKQALELLNKTDKIKIDDLLPYFPEEEKIQSLKEDLAKCLDQYGNKISKLNDTMKDYNESSKQLKKAIEDLKDRPVVINPGQSCDLTGNPILEEGSDFCIFPCGHCFKLEALFNFWKGFEPSNDDLAHLKLMIMKTQGEIDAFKGRKQFSIRPGQGSMDSRSQSISRGAGSILNTFGALFGAGKNKKRQGTADGGSTHESFITERQPSFLSQVYSMRLSNDEELKVNALIKEFCDYITNECVLCGDVLIDQAMQTFEPFDDEDFEEERSWAIKKEV